MVFMGQACQGAFWRNGVGDRLPAVALMTSQVHAVVGHQLFHEQRKLPQVVRV